MGQHLKQLDIPKAYFVDTTDGSSWRFTPTVVGNRKTKTSWRKLVYKAAPRKGKTGNAGREITDARDLSEYILRYNGVIKMDVVSHKYDENVANYVCELLMQVNIAGFAKDRPYTLAEIEKMEGMPKRIQLNRWSEDENNKLGDRTFAEAYEEARKINAEYLAESVISRDLSHAQLGEDPKIALAKVQLLKNQQDIALRYLEKARPKEWGNKQQIDIVQKTPVVVNFLGMDQKQVIIPQFQDAKQLESGDNEEGSEESGN